MIYLERERCPYCGNEEPYDKIYYCEGCGNVYCDACTKDKEFPTCPHCHSRLVLKVGFILPRARPVKGGKAPPA